MLKQVYRWTRDLHLYVGLFLSPFILVYALSAVVINHVALPHGGVAGPIVERRSVRIDVRDDANSLEVAKQIREQLGIAGEIGFVNRTQRGRRITFPVQTPVSTTTVRVDMSTGIAELERSDQGTRAALVYLHKMPGPHNASIRGNWVATRLWGWLADWTVYLVLFVSATGIYLWTVLKTERKAGLVCLGAGVVSFVAIVIGIVA
jgi:hypothetical protein